jgi:drug/metabolite transporter (DMT)-like permease
LSSTATGAPNPDSSRPTAILLASGLAAVLAMWSINYIVATITLEHFDLLTLISFRFEIAGAIMLGIYFAQKRRTPLQRRHIWTFVVLAFFGAIVNQGLFTTGLKYSIPSHSAIIVALDPVLILVLARMMGIESLSAGKIVGMALAFAGIVLLEVAQGSQPHSPFLMGDLITFGCAIGFSIYAALAKRLTPEYDAVALNTFNLVGAAIAFLPVTVHQAIRLDWRSVGWQGWAGLLYMAIFSSVLAYLAFYWTLRHMDASRVAAINYLQPILVVILASAFLGEHPSNHLLEGTALVLAGVYLAERGARII